MMTDFNTPDEISFEKRNGLVRFFINDLSTDWMNLDDSFLKRISKDNINEDFTLNHLTVEIRMKNTLDEGIRLVDCQKYQNAIKKFDRILFYDSCYADAVMYKSHALRGQKHFVKALRYYNRAIKADDNLQDCEYYRILMDEASEECSNFPVFKRNIYEGDEYFSKGQFEKAVESYNHALLNSSKLNDKILSKLLNKKATSILKLHDFENALECFKKSWQVEANDYAVFSAGICEYNLHLKVNDKFKTPLNISKKQMLKQASVLNDLGYFKESLVICDYLCQNHFVKDDFYTQLYSLKNHASNHLKS